MSKKPSDPFTISRYLQQMDTLVRGANQGYPFKHTLYSLVRDHGVQFDPKPRPGHLRKRHDRMCFRNAIEYVAEHPDCTYVEGIAIASYDLPFATTHGWVRQPDGTMLDLTWEPVGVEYFGIPFKWSYVARVMLDTGMYGILDNFNNRSIYETDEDFKEVL